jgi:DNA-binding PadR family transcriptional regulator
LDPAKLTELEACVLGLVLSEGPCTPYAIFSVLRDSPSPQWSGSAGAIYPVFRRLQSRGLVVFKAQSQGRRSSRVCRATAAGKEALRRWLGPPFPEWIAEVPNDPLRTRVRFLDVLPPARRRAFLAEAMARLAEQVERLEEDLLARPSLTAAEVAMARGAVLLVQARLAWITETARAFGC